MLKDKKILFYLLVILYLGIGIYLSITTGITSDESFEQLNWDKNVSGIISLLNFGHYDEFLRYLDKYHGIAFHYISQPIQFFISNLVSNLNEVSDFGGHLMSKHSIVFLIFSLSGIYFFRLINKITQNLFFSYLSTSLYLLYPYLFGHSLGATGVHEAIYSLLMMKNNFISGSANIENLDDSAKDCNILLKTENDVEIEQVMSNSFGFGGTNATLVFSKYHA